MPESAAKTTRLQLGETAALLVEIPTVVVRVLDGPDRDLQAALQLPLVRIGASPENDVVLTDPSISRFHAEVRPGPDGLVLKDLGSTNGTFLGSARVREVVLRGATAVRLGSTGLELGSRLEGVKSPILEADRLGALLGRSPAMRELYAMIRAAAPTQATILVQGESGTGKELVVRALHEHSGRKGPLVVFDASTADPELMRSDLFGHKAGAFTGAAGDRAGAFREAHRGTLFLDEIGELPLDLQPKLLRVLENREVIPLGTDRPVPIDVRVVAATHRDLDAMVAAGRFRADLFHRLAVLRLALPPLRDRGDDVLLLAERFLAGLKPGARLSDGARAALRAHPWPGNVRELRNALERAAALDPGPAIEARALGLAAPVALAPAPAAAPGGRLEDSERDQILATLARCGGIRSKAAKELGISVTTLWRRLKTYGID